MSKINKNKQDKNDQLKQDGNQSNDTNEQEQKDNTEPQKAKDNDEKLAYDTPFLSQEAKTIIDRINKLEKERQVKRDQSIMIAALLKKKSTYDKKSDKAIEIPTPAQKKVLRLARRANRAFDVAITAQIEMEKENLANLVKQGAKKLDNQMLTDRINSPYFLKKNKAHIRKAIAKILEDLKKSDPRAFRELKSLSTQRSKSNKKRFEMAVLELVRSGGDNLLRKFTATVKFKEEMLDFVRERITSL